MQIKRYATMFAAVCLLATTTGALAAPHDRDPRAGAPTHRQHQVHQDRGERFQNPGHVQRVQRPTWQSNHYVREKQRWQRGERLPSAYRSQRHIVNDWHRHGLRAPARGQRWVSAGSDYLLIAAATGVILQAVLAR